jgi:hypothetical protein
MIEAFRKMQRPFKTPFYGAFALTLLLGGVLLGKPPGMPLVLAGQMDKMPGMSGATTDPAGNPCDTMGGMQGMSVMGESMAAMTNHMCITPMRPEQQGDEERAKAVVDQVRAAIEKYKD